MKTPSARYFMRREDYAPRSTNRDSPFRKFNVSCLECGSVKLRLVSELDEETGEMAVILLCPGCQNRERMPVR